MQNINSYVQALKEQDRRVPCPSINILPVDNKQFLQRLIEEQAQFAFEEEEEEGDTGDSGRKVEETGGGLLEGALSYLGEELLFEGEVLTYAP